MAAVVGTDEALQAWAQAGEATGARSAALDLENLERTAQWLIQNATDPLLRVVARSCLVRLRAYQVLSTLEGRTP
jgi:hypothetical protein